MDQDSKEKFLQKSRDTIARCGWQVLAVPGEENPPFAYTIGLEETFDHPELLMLGLNLRLMQDLLNDLGQLIKKGEQFQEGQLVHKILKDEPISFITLNSEQVQEYLRLACALYPNREIKAFQAIWPDEHGLFPHQSQCEEQTVTSQKLL